MNVVMQCIVCKLAQKGRKEGGGKKVKEKSGVAKKKQGKKKKKRKSKCIGRESNPGPAYGKR